MGKGNKSKAYPTFIHRKIAWKDNLQQASKIYNSRHFTYFRAKDMLEYS